MSKVRNAQIFFLEIRKLFFNLQKSIRSMAGLIKAASSTPLPGGILLLGTVVCFSTCPMGRELALFDGGVLKDPVLQLLVPENQLEILLGRNFLNTLMVTN